MNIIYWLFGINKSKIEKPIRRYIKDVKHGECIYIEYPYCKGGIAHTECLENDPVTKKILLQIHWSPAYNGMVYEKFILDYNSYNIKNFHLLNNKNISYHEKEPKDTDIISLQKQMNNALEKEEYEMADELQKKIDKLSKNK